MPLKLWRRKRRRAGGKVPGLRSGGRADRKPRGVAKAVGNVAQGRTIPESPATLAAQQEQLVLGRRPVQMFPARTPELDLPRGFQRVAVGGHVFHYNPKQIRPEHIAELSRQGRENEFLGLGPVSKRHALMLGATRGDPPVTLTERRPDGVEVRGSLATKSTLPWQKHALEAGKEPGNTIHAEHPLVHNVRRLKGG